jgi:uncharacterized protein YecT (DUF1311 family)
MFLNLQCIEHDKGFMLKLIMVIAICFVATAAFAQVTVKRNCGGDTIQTNKCIGDAVTRADHLLSTTYQLLKDELNAGTNVPGLDFEGKRDALIDAQQAWVQFREAQCDAEEQRAGPGSGMGGAKLLCLLALTNERIRYLSHYSKEIAVDSCLPDKSKCAAP